jgi:predicted nucleic acid-binding protein
LLAYVADEVCVPEGVWEECVVQGSGRPGAAEIANASWIRVLKVADGSEVQRLRGELDLGESEAIVLAKQLVTPVLMDERRGRAVARREGVAVVGTAGILLQLKSQGTLAAVNPVIQTLVSAGWRISDNLLRAVLNAAGEATP